MISLNMNSYFFEVPATIVESPKCLILSFIMELSKFSPEIKASVQYLYFISSPRL